MAKRGNLSVSLKLKRLYRTFKKDNPKSKLSLKQYIRTLDLKEDVNNWFSYKKGSLNKSRSATNATRVLAEKQAKKNKKNGK